MKNGVKYLFTLNAQICKYAANQIITSLSFQIINQNTFHDDAVSQQFIIFISEFKLTFEVLAFTQCRNGPFGPPCPRRIWKIDLVSSHLLHLGRQLCWLVGKHVIERTCYQHKAIEQQDSQTNICIKWTCPVAHNACANMTPQSPKLISLHLLHIPAFRAWREKYWKL